MAEFGETLSPRELDVLGCIVNGASNKEVAAELHISQNTVKVHLRNIYTKLGASSRTEAVTISVQQGIATIPGTEVKPEPVPIETASIPGETPRTDTELAETAVSPPSLEPAPPTRNWLRYGMIGMVVLILLITAVYFGYQALNPTSPLSPTTQPTAQPATQPPAPYTEEAIGQTHWLTSRPLTTPLADMAVASVGIDIYHIGGETEAGVTNLVNRFDTSDRTWHEMAEKPTAVSAASAAVLFGEIYVPGGRTENGEPTNIVEAYSPANNAWRPIANLPKPISNGLALSDGSYLYMIGGWDGSEYLDDVYVYDAGSNNWRPLTKLPTPLASATGGVIMGELFILGGTDGQEILATCSIYNVDENTWQECPAMLSPRNNAGAAIVFNKLYILGGDETVGTELPFGEFYDPTTQTWQVVNTPMLTETTTWTNLGVTNVEARIYALGGSMGETLSDGNFVYSPLFYQTFIPAASGGGDTQP